MKKIEKRGGARVGAGAPQKSDKKALHIIIRVSAEEKKAAEENARSAGMKLSEFLRARCIDLD